MHLEHLRKLKDYCTYKFNVLDSNVLFITHQILFNPI